MLRVQANSFATMRFLLVLVYNFRLKETLYVALSSQISSLCSGSYCFYGLNCHVCLVTQNHLCFHSLPLPPFLNKVKQFIKTSFFYLIFVQKSFYPACSLFLSPAYFLMTLDFKHHHYKDLHLWMLK